MKNSADKPAANLLAMSNEQRELQQQIARARATLADLNRKISAAGRSQADFADSGYLVEVNEKLIVSALQSQTKAEEAESAFGELTKAFGVDSLTQLANRGLFHERFAYAIASAQRRGTRVALMFADIDGFKRINDSLGHAVGDEVLKHTAHCIANSVRDVDFVFRYGGDEFVMLITDLAHASDAALVSQKVATAVACPFTVDSRNLRVSLSIGTSIYPDDGENAEGLMGCADAAMYHAKRLRAREQR